LFIVMEPAQAAPTITGRLLPKFDGTPRDLELNGNAPATFAID
jgi:hypothetical protein